MDRTKEYVLTCTARLLAAEGVEAVTFSRVSQVSRVARSTLYRHWRSRDDLICAACVPGFSVADLDRSVGARAFLVVYLTQIARGLSGPQTLTAFAGALDVAGHEPRTGQNFRLVAAAFERVLEERLGKIDDWQLSRILGPIVFNALVLRAPADEKTVAAWVDELLGPDEVRSSG